MKRFALAIRYTRPRKVLFWIIQSIEPRLNVHSCNYAREMINIEFGNNDKIDTWLVVERIQYFLALCLEFSRDHITSFKPTRISARFYCKDIIQWTLLHHVSTPNLGSNCNYKNRT